MWKMYTKGKWSSAISMVDWDNNRIFAVENI